MAFYKSRGYELPTSRGVLPADELLGFEVSPLRAHWCLVFADAQADHTEVARFLSETLATEVLHSVATVGEPVRLALFQGRKLIAETRAAGDPPAPILELAPSATPPRRRRRSSPSQPVAAALRDRTALGISGLRDRAHQGRRHRRRGGGLPEARPAQGRVLSLIHRLKMWFARPDLGARPTR
ncbi:MAG: hypothetical protein U0166_03745 [Acidobacteriota bacterium]